jgi:hypothetical protein
MVEYKPGALNMVAYALSRHDTKNGNNMAVSAPRFDFLSRLHQA